MNRVSQHEPEHLSLLQQLKGSYASVNMTLLSIIQGVAWADLAGVAGANYTQFTLVHHLLREGLIRWIKTGLLEARHELVVRQAAAKRQSIN